MGIHTQSLLHPLSRSINPGKQINQPPRIHETSCVCSSKSKTHRGNTHAECITPEQVHQRGQGDQLAVPNSRDQLRRVLHPSSRAINPFKAFNQPSRIHETSCACSWQMRNTRRGMHSERSTHRGDYTSIGMYTDRSTHRGLHAEDGRCTVHALTRLLANVAIGLAGMYKYVHVQ